MQPKVSVVMSVYNGTLYLQESVESILNQTFTDFEFIIIDDGSTDETWEILTEYANRDQRVKLFKNKENIGLTKSLNKGIKWAKGEYIARQDADDVSLPDRFKLQTCFLNDNIEVGALGTSAEVINEQGIFLEQGYVIKEHESIQACLLVNNCLYHSSMMLRRSLVQALGGYREELHYAQDYDIWWRISRLARIENLPNILIRVRRSAKNISNLYRHEQLRSALEISLKIVHESLEGQPLDEDAYQRFWWSYLQLLDEDVDQQFWVEHQGKYTQLQRIDIQRLWPFWKLLADHAGGPLIWGPRLRRLGYNLLHRRQTVEGLELLSIVTRQLKMPIQLNRLFKGLIKPYVPGLGQQLWKNWQLKQQIRN